MAKKGRTKRDRDGIPMPVTTGGRSRSGTDAKRPGSATRSGTDGKRTGNGTRGSTEGKRAGSGTRGSTEGKRAGSGTRTGSAAGTYTLSGSGTALSESLSRVMSAVERPTAALCYHTLVSIAVFAAGVLLIVLGSWAINTRFGGVGVLPLRTGLVRRTVRSAGGVCVGFGIVSVLAGLAGCAGLVTSGARYGFVALGLVTLVGWCLIGVFGFLVASRAEGLELRRDMLQAWNSSGLARTVIMRRRRCMGFDVADANTLARNGACYFAISNLLMGVSVPTALGASMGSVLLLIDLCVVFLV